MNDFDQIVDLVMEESNVEKLNEDVVLILLHSKMMPV
jgi:hypothetical protein